MVWAFAFGDTVGKARHLIFLNPLNPLTESAEFGHVTTALWPADWANRDAGVEHRGTRTGGSLPPPSSKPCRGEMGWACEDSAAIAKRRRLPLSDRKCKPSQRAQGSRPRARHWLQHASIWGRPWLIAHGERLQMRAVRGAPMAGVASGDATGLRLCRQAFPAMGRN
ncbi:hypothetical protein BS50DRAFT_306183 [Corynespora cassiicola Philippines]|uniref:Uncharacterized protein n=1 Tax=Corynespora cassiicola Philippines TaxID=1448308 RepID=A0A2T2NXH7_CORCC|nr:hypothetical protein BS50DRAFT_306183 [Corynespora cassiicola Philippines]